MEGSPSATFFDLYHLLLRGESMQKYDVRRGQESNLATERLRDLIMEAFGGAKEEEGKLVASFGALERLTTWAEGRSLCVDTQMKIDVSNEVASETIKRYNLFLEKVTGYTAKERGKKAQQKAKKGK